MKHAYIMYRGIKKMYTNVFELSAIIWGALLAIILIEYAVKAIKKAGI